MPLQLQNGIGDLNQILGLRKVTTSTHSDAPLQMN